MADNDIKQGSTVRIQLPVRAPKTPVPLQEPPAKRPVYRGSRQWYMFESHYQFADGS